MSALRSVIKKEWLAMSRDVHGLLVLFLMPAAFILVMSLALKDTFQPSATKLEWRAWDGDGTAASAAFLARLPSTEGRVDAASREELARTLDAGKIQAALWIEPGFERGLAEEKNEHALARIEAAPGTPPALAAAFRAEAERALAVGRVEVLLKELTEGAEPGAGGVKAAELAEGARLDFAFRGVGGRPLTAVQQSVPAWLVFAMFFVVIPLSTIFIAEKQQGTLARLRSLGVSPALLLAGKVIPFYLVNLVQTALMLAVGRWVVPLLGGDMLGLDVNWFALWVMASAVSLAAIGFALAVAAFARTNEQATTIGGVANILFGALGGIMVPKLVMPAGMQAATWASPMAWGLDGFLKVFLEGAGAGELGRPVVLLIVFTVACMALAAWRLRGAVR